MGAHDGAAARDTAGDPAVTRIHAVYATGQLLGISAMTAGVLLLFGLPWALTIGGFAIFLGTLVGQATPPSNTNREV